MSGIAMALAADGGAASAAFVAGQFAAQFKQTPVLSTIGAAAGDFAIFSSLNGPPSGAAWTEFSNDGAFRHFSKTLTQADANSAVAMVSSSLLMIYRGGIASARYWDRVTPPSSTSIGKSAKHLGYIGMGFSRDPNALTQRISSVSPDFIIRGDDTIARSAVAGFDRLVPPNTEYPGFMTVSAVNPSPEGFVSILELRA